jgi:hypothetical protein
MFFKRNIKGSNHLPKYQIIKKNEGLIIFLTFLYLADGSGSNLLRFGSIRYKIKMDGINLPNLLDYNLFPRNLVNFT